MSEAWEQYTSKPGATDDRELLTDECIRADLLDRVKMTGLHLGLFLVPVALWALLMICFPKLFFLYIPINIIMLIGLVTFVSGFCRALSGYFGSRQKLRIVTDKKVGEKIVYPWWVGSIEVLLFIRKYCYLFFAKYGKYHLPLTSYKWSHNNQMDHGELMDISQENDVFYLVLGKNDRILMIYHCDYFYYQGDMNG